MCVSLRLIISFCWAPSCQNTERCLLPLQFPINHLFIWLKIMAAHMLLPVQLVVARLWGDIHTAVLKLLTPSPWQQLGRLETPPASVHELGSNPTRAHLPESSSAQGHSSLAPPRLPDEVFPTITLGGSQSHLSVGGADGHGCQLNKVRSLFQDDKMQSMDCLLREPVTFTLGATREFY